MKRRKIVLTLPLDSLSAGKLSKMDEAEDNSMSLAQAYRKFLEKNPRAASALRSAAQADSYHTSIVRDLYKFLVTHDIDAQVLLGKVFLKPLRNAAPRLEEAIKNVGEAKVRQQIQHAVIKANHLVIDLTHLRLGDNYTPLDNFPAREFEKYFASVEDITHLVKMTPEHIARILKQSDDLITKEAKRDAELAVASAKPSLLKRNRRLRPYFRVAK